MTKLSLDQTLAPAPPEMCPACGAKIYNDDDVNGLRVVQYGCGRKQTQHPDKDYWMVYKTCPQGENAAIHLRATVATLTAELKAMTDGRFDDVATEENNRDVLMDGVIELTTKCDELTARLDAVTGERDAARTSSATWKRCAKGWQQSSRHNGDELERVAKITRQQHSELNTLRAQVAEMRDALTKISLVYVDVSDKYEHEVDRSVEAAHIAHAALAPGGGVGEGETK